MKIVVFNENDSLQLGIVHDDRVLHVNNATRVFQNQLGGVQIPANVADFYKNGLHYLDGLNQLLAYVQDKPGGWWLDQAGITIAPIVPDPGKIMCIGFNYRRHAEEADKPIPKTPIVFSKFNNAIAATKDTVPLPATAQNCDYEAELVVVLGKTARNISVEDALDYVLGYCNGNDLSERDWQFRTSQFLLGKTLDKFLPIGPYLVTTDDIPDPQKLTIKGWYNGELRQHASTGEMIFSVAEIISYISQHFTLYAGDIIATGTPKGVIMGQDNPQWLKAGDTYTVEIEGLGQLTNTMG